MRLLALLAALAVSAPVYAGEVTVFAAASLKGALDQVAQDWQAETGHRAVLAYGGSPAMAKQLLAGAPAQVFISASAAWMDAVAEVTVAESRVDLLSNSLVVVAPAGAAALVLGPDLVARLQGGKLAMAMVDSVPAGQYGKAALQSLGLWDAVAGAVVETENVRAALALVAQGEAALGVVYGSDAVAEPGVSVVAEFPVQSHPAIVYRAALIAPPDAVAAEFLQYLQGDKAQAVFLGQGFLPPH